MSNLVIFLFVVLLILLLVNSMHRSYTEKKIRIENAKLRRKMSTLANKGVVPDVWLDTVAPENKPGIAEPIDLNFHVIKDDSISDAQYEILRKIFEKDTSPTYDQWADTEPLEVSK